MYSNLQLHFVVFHLQVLRYSFPLVAWWFISDVDMAYRPAAVIVAMVSVSQRSESSIRYWFGGAIPAARPLGNGVKG